MQPHNHKNDKCDTYKVIIFICTGIAVHEGGALFIYCWLSRKARLKSFCVSSCCVLPESYDLVALQILMAYFMTNFLYSDNWKPSAMMMRETRIPE